MTLMLIKLLLALLALTLNLLGLALCPAIEMCLTCAVGVLAQMVAAMVGGLVILGSVGQLVILVLLAQMRR